MNSTIVPIERIRDCIILLRGQKIILDRDLADLYGVETSALNRAVTRNKDRFPSDFTFRLTRQELTSLICQTGISKRGGTRKLPRAFTEQGVAMLSSVLRSKRAVQVNIEIMRAFVRLRELLSSHKDLEKRLNDLEKKYDNQFRAVFQAIRELMKPPTSMTRQIGFGENQKK